MSGLPRAPEKRLAELSLPRLTDEELERLHLQLFFESEVPPDVSSGSTAYRALAMLASRLARERQEATDPTDEVRAAQSLAWLRGRVGGLHGTMSHASSRDLTWLTNAYRLVVGRGIHPKELEHWLPRMKAPFDRELAIRALTQATIDEKRALEKRDHDACWIMGTSRTIRPEDWRRRDLEIGCLSTNSSRHGAPVRRRVRSETPLNSLDGLRQGTSRCLVSVIASIYRGGRFIEAFMENICSQSIFRDWCELIVVDAASPDDEGEVIRRFMREYPNVRYIRTPERVGIYEAWNIAVGEARGEFLTNANVDDLRRGDSLEIQAATLQMLPGADIVYQNVFYSLESGLTFDRVATFGFRSQMPLVTPAVLLSFNPPHNAPMWRRRLHDELGLFETRYRSAGDYEFWLRCMVAGKVFHRVNDPHVVYYHNPQGYSTRPDTTGHAETREITAHYASRLLVGASLRVSNGIRPVPRDLTQPGLIG